MTIQTGEALRALRQEAGRQADFYGRKGNSHLSQMYSTLESLAHLALTSGGTLDIKVLSKDVNKVIHMPCE